MVHVKCYSYRMLPRNDLENKNYVIEYMQPISAKVREWRKNQSRRSGLHKNFQFIFANWRMCFKKMINIRYKIGGENNRLANTHVPPSANYKLSKSHNIVFINTHSQLKVVWDIFIWWRTSNRKVTSSNSAGVFIYFTFPKNICLFVKYCKIW